jgi:uncharacterized membrane protein
MRALGRYWFAWTLVAAAFVTSVALYTLLPATIAIHWNARGVVDGWAPKWEGAFIAPCLAVILVVFLILLGHWTLEDGEDSQGQIKVFFYPTVVAAVAGICFYANATVLLVGVGLHLDIRSHAAIGLGLLIAVLGNTLGKVPQNRVVGIRTPWTLTDEGVWVRTHRIAGWLLVMAGIVSGVTGILGDGMMPGLISIGSAAAVSVGYSYLISRR